MNWVSVEIHSSVSVEIHSWVSLEIEVLINREEGDSAKKTEL